MRELWEKRSIVWLSGVRRIGKTILCRQVDNVRLYNCDLPSIRRQLSDPEFFLSQQNPDEIIALDEVHRLEDPSLLLKIAADAFPDLKILATGSSTLEATKKFRDTLTGRKYSVQLFPVLWSECLGNFNVNDFDFRLLRGGFPERLLYEEVEKSFFDEWLDSFYSRDVLELFGVRNRTGFLTLLRLICLRNGGQLDISDMAKDAGVSRPTVMAYLDALEIANAICRIPPFFGGGHREIIRRPRVFAFDTGLIAHVKGWESIRDTDRGHLWENLVLDELRSEFPLRYLHYWRDKSQREIDFVIDNKNGMVDAIEAKINPDAFEASALEVFRGHYPKGRNLIVCPFVKTPYSIRKKNMIIRVCSSSGIKSWLEEDG